MLEHNFLLEISRIPYASSLSILRVLKYTRRFLYTAWSTPTLSPLRSILLLLIISILNPDRIILYTRALHKSKQTALLLSEAIRWKNCPLKPFVKGAPVYSRGNVKDYHVFLCTALFLAVFYRLFKYDSLGVHMTLKGNTNTNYKPIHSLPVRPICFFFNSVVCLNK